MGNRIFKTICMLLVFNHAVHADQDVVHLAKEFRPCVVLIQTFDQNFAPLGQGSGFFVSSNGDLVTNRHVLEGAHYATVRLIDGQQYFVEGISAVDEEQDIIKLQVDLGKNKTPFIKLASMPPPIGEDIVVIGSPLGLDSTVSHGIVSAIRELHPFGKVLQVSAPISSGSSGSPVLNMAGQVVGVATFLVEKGQSLNFAVPADRITKLKVTDRLVRLSELTQYLEGKDVHSVAGELPRVKAVTNPCLKYLPSNWWLVANLNSESYFKFMAEFGDNNPVVNEMMSQYLEILKGLTGIDFCEDVQHMMLVISGNPNVDPQFLLIVKGAFDNAITQTRLGFGLGVNMRRKTYKGVTLYEDVDVGYVFPERSTLLFGSSKLLRASIDVLKQRNGQTQFESFYETLERTNGASVLWAALRPNILLELEELYGRNDERYEPLISPGVIDCISAFLDPASDGFLISVLGHASSRDEARKLHNYLDKTKHSYLHQEGANVFLCSFLLMSEVRVDESFVRWDIRLTMDSLFKLLDTKVFVKPFAVVGRAI